jgi:formamidopyrimidine-DNA glycosylase
MPELPEVQTTVNGINKHVSGLSILDVWTDYNSLYHAGKDNIKNPEFFKKFRKSIIGSKILKSDRRGKNILINLSSGKTIIIHMKMTGHVMYGKYKKSGRGWIAIESGPLRDDPYNRFIHLVFSLSNGNCLVLCDTRKFAKVTIGDTEKIHESDHLSSHGPEPLDKKFTSDSLKQALLKKPNSPIKQVMMNPEIISGIGNIYSDEILWRAGIHPLEKVKNISAKFWPIIWKVIRETLESGIDFGGDSMSDYRNILGERGKFQEKHNAYRKTGEKCTKRGCTGKIVRIKIGGRSAHFCDKHQKLLRKIS